MDLHIKKVADRMDEKQGRVKGGENETENLFCGYLRQRWELSQCPQQELKE